MFDLTKASKELTNTALDQKKTNQVSKHHYSFQKLYQRPRQ